MRLRILKLITILIVYLILSLDLNANENLMETQEIKFAPELVVLAESLDKDPVKIYNWVYNHIDLEDYETARKDALSVFWTKGGNEWDISSLLITLFRISGIESRYLVGSFNNITVEAFVSVGNYRGNGNGDKEWIALAPWKKEYRLKRDLNFFQNRTISTELNFDFNNYLSSSKDKTALELFEERLQEYVLQNNNGKTLKDIGLEKEIIKNELDILPLSLPLGIISGSSRYAEIPRDADHKQRVDYYVKNKNGTKILSQTLYLSEIASSRVVLDFISNTSDTNNLKAVIKIDGKVIAESSETVNINDTFKDGHNQDGRGDKDRPSKKVGSIVALNFDIANESEEFITRLKEDLLKTNLSVLNNINTREQYIGKYVYLISAIYNQRTKQALKKANMYLYDTVEYFYYATRVYTNPNDINYNGHGYNEKYIIHPAIQIDALLLADGENWNSEFNKLKRKLYMYDVSYNEGRIFEDIQSTEGANTIKAIMLANDNGIEVLDINKDNLSLQITKLQGQKINRYPDDFINDIANVIQKDSLATVKTPIQSIKNNNLNMNARIENGNNYDAYLFNLNNGGASTDIPIEKVAEMCTISEPTFSPNRAFFNVQNSSETSMILSNSSYEAEAEPSHDGDPVNMFSGEFYQEEKPDLSLKIVGDKKLEIVRTYKSQLDYNGAFGYGWAWNHMERLLIDTSGDLVYVNNKGIFSTITKYSNSYGYVPGAKYTLSFANNIYTLHFYDGSKQLFNTNGLLLEKQDIHNNKIIFEYGSNNRMSKIKDESGQYFMLTYNANNKITNITDSSGRSLSYDYGVGGTNDDLTSFRNLANKTTSYEYLINQENPKNNHNMSKYILPNGDFLALTYYKNDQVSHHTNKNGDSFNFSYSRYNRYSETWNEEGYYRKVYFNEYGDEIRVDKRDGTIETKVYDNNHNMISSTNANGFTTKYTYDNNRNILTTINPLGETITYTYNSKNRIISIKDAMDNITTFNYYPNEIDVKEKILPNGSKISYSYDSYGNILSTTDATNNSEVSTYDSYGINLLTKRDKKGNSTTFNYDRAGRIISLTNQKGYTKRIEYFVDDKIKTETDELSNQTAYSYDDNGNLITKVHPNNSVENFTYYTAKDIVVGNLVKEKKDSFGNFIYYKYDKLGNVIEEKDKKGNITYYAYNELNKIITKTLPNQYTIHYTYDGVGNIVKEESSYLDESTLQNKTITTSYNYNSANRLISKITSKNLTINYEYDKNGNVTLEYYTINSDIVKTKYEYNSLNQLVKLIKGFGSNSERITSYGYDTLGRKISETNAFGIVTQYQYDKNNNLLKIFLDNILIEENIYDELNRIVKHYDGNRNLTQYAYNGKNEKIQTIDATNNQYNYEYDSMGNLIKESFPNNTYKTYSYNHLNKPTSKTNNLNQTKYLSYDENMNVTRITDAKGNYTTFNYDVLNRQISQTNAARDMATTTYDERGNIVAKQDFNGNLVTFSYDEANNKTSQNVHLENEILTTTYKYDILNRLISVIDPKGGVTSYSYNIYNENTKQTDAKGIITQTNYDKLGRVEQIIDKKGIITQFVYNALNQKIQTKQAVGTSDEVVTNFTYDTNGNLLTQSVDLETNMIVTSYEYDSLNRLLNTKVDNVSVQSQTYDSVGNIASKIDGNGNTTSFTYDANNKPITQTNPKGAVISYSYDENSNLISTITSEGVKRLNEYDNLNRVTTTTIDNATKEFFYDKNGNIIKEMDYNGNVTLYSYDKANRVISQIKAANSNDESILSYTYDKNSNIVTLTDENGKITTYSYDLLNRKVKHTYPSGNSKSFEYDNNDNISKITKEDGTSISQSYDNLNRLKTVSANGTIQQTFTYDALSRVISSKDTNSNTKHNTVTYTYDSRNNIISSTQNGKTISKEYDSNSNLTLLTLPNNKVVKNSYDTVNNLASVSLGNSQIVSFTYNQDNQLQTQTTSNGTTLTLGYDNVGRETKRSYKTSSNNILFSSTLTYDRNSNIIKEQIVKNNQTILKEYAYDSKDQIKSFAQTENSYRAKNNSYSYDKASNIIEKILEDNVAHSNEQIYKEVNEDNQYTSVKSNSSNVTISYDANGNIKTYKDKTFTYDFLNRLISVKQNSTTLATYTYDASNRRVSKTVSNKTITYLYHNNQVVQEYENDILTNTYLYGEYIDDPIAYSYNNNLYFYLKDNRYSVQAITNQSSSVVESYSYSPFGILTVYDENHNVVSNSNLNNTVTFTGRRYDSESNLYDYRNRMYSPELARFISKDPKGYVDGMNLYAYVKNNPLRYLDPMGTTARSSVSNMVSNSDDIVEQTIKFTNAQSQPSTLTYSTNSSDYNIETKTRNTITTIGQIGNMSYKTTVNPSMTQATYGNSSYTKFSNGIEIVKGNGSVSSYNPSSQKRSQNEYATTPYVQPTQYEKDKASAKLFGDITKLSTMVSAVPGLQIFGTVATFSNAISYSIEPDKSLDNDFSQIFGDAFDLFQQKRK